MTITNEDLDLVNKIRYWMNVCLSKTEPDQLMRLTQTISLDKAQKGIKEAMEELLGLWLKAAEEGQRGDLCEENYQECEDQKMESKLTLQVVVDNYK